MKRFDPISAVLGVIFVLAGLYFADGSRRPSFSDLGLVVPLLLIVIGIAVIMRNSQKKN